MQKKQRQKHRSATKPTFGHRIDLINENDGGRLLACGGKQLAHAHGAHAHVAAHGGVREYGLRKPHTRRMRVATRCSSRQVAAHALSSGACRRHNECRGGSQFATHSLTNSYCSIRSMRTTCKPSDPPSFTGNPAKHRQLCPASTQNSTHSSVNSPILPPKFTGNRQLCPYRDSQLHKLRSGDGEEGHSRLSWREDYRAREGS